MVEVKAENKYVGYVAQGNPNTPQPSAGFLAAMGAAFRTENDIVAATEYLTRPVFQWDDEFDITKALNESQYTLDYSDTLARAQSREEFDSIEQRITKELQDRKLLAGQSGGWAMQIASGMLSPTMAVPLLGPARGVKGAAQATALAFAGASAQELTLYNAQETRTIQETVLGITAGTVLGGLLGTGVNYLRKGDFERISTGMAQSLEDTAVSKGSGAGAVNEVEADIPIPVLRDEIEVDLTIPSARGDIELSSVRVMEEVKPTLIARSTNVITGQLTRVQRAFDTAVASGETSGKAISRTGGTVTMRVGADADVAVYMEVSELRALTRVDGKTSKPIEEVKPDGSFDPTEGEVLLRVNDQGEAFVVKGGEYLDSAQRNGSAIGSAPAVRVQVEYMNNGNTVKGDWQPDNLLKRLFQNTEDLRNLDEIENAKALKKAEEGGGQGSTGIGGDIGAALAPIRKGTQFRAPNGLVRKYVFNQLAKLNPITRSINQTLSPRLSFWVAQISDAGLKTADNIKGVAHAIGGSLEARVGGYDAIIAKAVKTYDESYAKYVLNGSTEEEVSRMKVWATQSQAGVERVVKGKIKVLPTGKMNLDEFDAYVFELANTGKTVDDVNIMAAVAVQRKFFDEYLTILRGAEADVSVKFGTDSPKLLPDEFNLGDGVTDYIHHSFDAKKVIEDSGGFTNVLTVSAEKHYNSSFRKAQTRVTVQLSDLENSIKFLESTDAAKNKTIAALDKSIADIKANEVYMGGQARLENTKTQMEGATAKEVREEVGDLGQEYNSLAQQLSSAQSYVRGLKRYQKDFDKALGRLPKKKRTVAARKELSAKESLKLRKQVEKLEDDFDTDWRARGAEGGDLIESGATFARQAREDAIQVYTHIVGQADHVSGMDILGGKRGPTLARTLDIPFAEKMKYLVTNPEQVMRIYGRKMAGDIELYRLTGSVNGARIIDDVNADFEKELTRLQTTDTDVKKPAVFNPDGSIKSLAVTVPMTAELRAKRLTELAKARDTAKTDLEVIVTRIRHQRGIPDNPDGMGYRLGRAAMSINVFRNMGMVTISSLPDVGRPVMKVGLMNTLRQGWAPMVTDVKRLKMSRQLARSLGAGLDPILHNRSRQVFDVLDNYSSKQTFVERGVEFLANKTGFIAGFDRWTAENKLLTSNIYFGLTSQYLREVNVGKVGGKQFKEAQEFLASHGIDTDLSRRIWKQFDDEGSTAFKNDVRLPNMEVWDDAGAIGAYSAGMNKFVDDAIVTPGLDRPNWVDANVASKMVAQFRSFTFTSTNRTVMAGLQDWDMQLLNGVAVSLGMGTLSYYLWAVSVGGSAYDEMMEADAGVWADQAISRSGLLGVFAEPWTILQRIPGINESVTFGGEPIRNYRGTSLMSAIAGPSFDLGEKLLSVGMSVSYPTQATAQTIRKMSAYQNVFWLRQLYEKLAQGTAEAVGLPEQRDFK